MHRESLPKFAFASGTILRLRIKPSERDEQRMVPHWLVLPQGDNGEHGRIRKCGRREGLQTHRSDSARTLSHSLTHMNVCV
jgi:hypothetical protein